MEQEKIAEILRLHELWLRGDSNGVRANLAGADLTHVNLAKANLKSANLAGVSLAGACLKRANLKGANLAEANLAEANLNRSILANANLSGANLVRASLAYANLTSANLTDAILSGAILARANLHCANLVGAEGLPKALCTPIALLEDQVGSIRLYKLVTANMRSPISSKIIKYAIGETVEERNVNCDDTEHCAAGISLATLDWCLKEWWPGCRILIAEFHREDIAAIPIGSDGKIRVKRCKIIGEKDLAKLGMCAIAINGKVRVKQND